MRKTLVIFDHALTLRSYTETNELIVFSENAEVRRLFVSSSANREFTEALKIFDFENITLNRFHQFLLTVNSIRYWSINSNRSKSFESRIRSIKSGRREFYDAKRPKIRKLPIANILGNIASYFPFSVVKYLLVPVTKKVFSQINLRNYDSIIYVGTGGSLFLNDVIGISVEECGADIEYFLVSENWDNITSKAVLNIEPSRIGVWGQNGIEFCSSIHDIDKSKLIAVGSPRIDFIARSLASVSDSEKLKRIKIAYLGGSIDFDRDLNFFEEVKNAVEKYIDLTELLYLPHPKNYRRFIEAKIFQNDLSSNQIVINKKIQESLKSHQMIPLSLYVDILSNCRLTVSPLSTMNLESLLYGIPTIALDFREDLLTNSPWATDFFEHFRGLRNYPGIKIVREIAKISETIDKSLFHSDYIPKDKILDYPHDFNFGNKVRALMNISS